MVGQSIAWYLIPWLLQGPRHLYFSMRLQARTMEAQDFLIWYEICNAKDGVAKNTHCKQVSTSAAGSGAEY